MPAGRVIGRRLRRGDGVSDAQATRFTAELATLDVAAGEPLALAVSGGGDSLALLLLAAATGRALHVATVDHGLRAEAAAEAREVATICAGLGVPHATLRVSVAPAGGGPQAAARHARYAALAAWCPAPVLLTAHQRDDVAESLLMRLARGSGVRGLARMAATAALAPGRRLVRPLLGWSRAELAAVVAAAGLVAAEDPSNADPRFGRSRARTLLAATDWLDPARLARAAANLAEADAALGWLADEAWRSRVERDGAAWTIDADGLPRDTRRRLAARVLGELGLPDPDGLDGFVRALDSGRPATLGPVAAKPGPPWRLAPAPQRRENAPKAPAAPPA